MDDRITALTDEVARHRRPNYDILPLLVNRWSPRSTTGEPLADDELFPLFEAARSRRFLDVVR